MCFWSVDVKHVSAVNFSTVIPPPPSSSPFYFGTFSDPSHSFSPYLGHPFFHFPTGIEKRREGKKNDKDDEMEEG